MAHQIVLAVTFILIAVIALVFAFVISRSGKREEYEPIQKKAYRIRNIYFIVLFLFLTGALVVTIQRLPYDKPAHAAAETYVIKAEGSQFVWEMSSNQVKVNQLVEFQVTSADVNHGFGIYNKDMKLIAQTQAMPDYTNKLYYTFTEPGEYQILCMEYCGLAHHYMIGEFEVVAGDGEGA